MQPHDLARSVSFSGARAIRAELKRAATLTRHEDVAEWAKLWEVNPKAGEMRWVKADGAPLHRVAKPDAAPKTRNGERRKSESGGDGAQRKGNGERRSESGGDGAQRKGNEERRSENGGDGAQRKGNEERRSESGGDGAQRLGNGERKSESGGDGAQRKGNGEKKTDSAGGLRQHTQSAGQVKTGGLQTAPHGEKIGSGERQGGGAGVGRHQQSSGGEQMKRSREMNRDAVPPQQAPGTVGSSKRQRGGKADAHSRDELMSGDMATPVPVVQESEGKGGRQGRRGKKEKGEALLPSHMARAAPGVVEPINGGVGDSPGGVQPSAHTEDTVGPTHKPRNRRKRVPNTADVEGTTGEAARAAAHTPSTHIQAHPTASTSHHSATTEATDPAGHHPQQPAKQKQRRRRKHASADTPGTRDNDRAQGKASNARSEEAIGKAGGVQNA